MKIILSENKTKIFTIYNKSIKSQMDNIIIIKRRNATTNLFQIDKIITKPIEKINPTPSYDHIELSYFINLNQQDLFDFVVVNSIYTEPYYLFHYWDKQHCKVTITMKNLRSIANYLL